MKDDELVQQEDSVSQTDDSNEQNDEVFKPEIKEESMTEEEATSSVTESSGSNYVMTKDERIFGFIFSNNDFYSNSNLQKRRNDKIPQKITVKLQLSCQPDSYGLGLVKELSDQALKVVVKSNSIEPFKGERKP